MAMPSENEYADVLGIVLDKTPKRVFAAMLVSEYVNRLGLSGVEVVKQVQSEWQALYNAGVLPQKCRITSDDINSVADSKGGA